MPGFFARLKRHFFIFFAVLGPGFITAVVDNDSGGIYTYSQAGARWGYLPLWTLLPITIALIVTQEMCSRMGAVTGKGLSDLIREEFGLRITFGIMLQGAGAHMNSWRHPSSPADASVNFDFFVRTARKAEPADDPRKRGQSRPATRGPRRREGAAPTGA